MPVEEAQWFAMRDLTRPNAKMPAFRMLSERGFEVFTPMVTKLSVNPAGKKLRLHVPAIHDLLFVHSTTSALDPIVEHTPTLQYRYAKGLGYRVPMTVRTAEMARFIFAASLTESPQYYQPSEITPDMYGRRVRIIGGPMDGYEGFLLKARGTRKRRLIVNLDTFLALAVEVAPEFIALLPD
ncbi:MULTISPECIES: UpxY family transcription antiterminator [Duncaniella]|uniref:UpxY family transcription antiterminator n=1 Tax=Duncaniella dubosii TaxID=2518971 RepID=A0A4P7VZV7_9BACT|nr:MULTISPECIES: UpxY family transcription antiterminator [Duncaniella]MCX4284679.1 UpxY family transcription antiterminator [Duncaniella dubosii]QCD40992.1 UpxY family transcription antiterminator [Duncaniella dubosii]HBN63457.1 transcriptional regulator [Porphyromonadaceae bacterium]